MPPNKPRAVLRADRLEDRLTPAVFGTPWPDANHLTASFAPDTTAIGSVGSSLFAKLGTGTAPAWQLETLKALQAWSSQANINVGYVPDTGTAFGTPGATQGKAGAGDIRVGGRPLSALEVAATTPYDLLGKGSGELVVNSAMPLSVGGSTTSYDLYTVFLQEAGHALGIGNSTDPLSAQFETYQGARTGLGASDIAAIKALYGARLADKYEGSDGNNTAGRATSLSWADGGSGDGDKPTVAVADITTAADKDFYKLQVPKQTPVTVSLKTTGVSLLTAKVTVYDKDGKNVIQSRTAVDPRTGDLILTIPGADRDAYMVSVEAAPGTAFAVGAYRLSVGTASAAAAGVAAPVTGFGFADYGSNDTFGTAVNLTGIPANTDGRWDGTLLGGISPASDRDFFKFKAAAGGTVGLATVWATAGSTLDPVVRVYDSAGNKLPVDVFAAGNGTYTVQYRNAVPGQVYTVEVAAANPAGTAATGNYAIALNHRAAALDLPTLASATLTDQAKQHSYQLTTTGSRTFHYDLAVSGVSANTAVRVTVYDSAGAVVGSFAALAGTSVGFDLRLPAGVYTLKVSGGEKTGAAFAVGFTLKGIVRDDPLGPIFTDPTIPPPPPPPPMDLGDLGGWGGYDPYSDPWFGW